MPLQICVSLIYAVTDMCVFYLRCYRDVCLLSMLLQRCVSLIYAVAEMCVFDLCCYRDVCLCLPRIGHLQFSCQCQAFFLHLEYSKLRASYLLPC